MGHNSNSSQSSPMKSSNDGTENFLKRELGMEGFWVLATKSGRNENVHDLHPRERRTLKERPCNSLTLLADTRPSKKDVFQVKCLSETNLRGSKGDLDKQRRTRERFQSGGSISRGGQDLSKWRNILETMELAGKSIPVKEKTWLKAALYPLTTVTERPSS